MLGRDGCSLSSERGRLLTAHICWHVMDIIPGSRHRRKTTCEAHWPPLGGGYPDTCDTSFSKDSSIPALPCTATPWPVIYRFQNAANPLLPGTDLLLMEGHDRWKLILTPAIVNTFVQRLTSPHANISIISHRIVKASSPPVLNHRSVSTTTYYPKLLATLPSLLAFRFEKSPPSTRHPGMIEAIPCGTHPTLHHPRIAPR